METIAKSIAAHKDPKGAEAKGASDFLEVLIAETDGFYNQHGEILSSNGKRPHNRSQLPENKQWNENMEQFYEKNPRRRPRK